MNNKISIALLEDNFIHKEILSAYLCTKDNVVLHTTEEGVDLDDLLCYDIVLVDRVLPNRRGEDIVDYISSKGRTAILYSSDCIPADIECIGKSDFISIDKKIKEFTDNINSKQ